MYLKEVVIQGLFGVAKGVRLPLNAGLCEPLVPPPLDIEKFKRVLCLLLYPEDAVVQGGIRVDTDVPYHVRLGAVFDLGGLEYKLTWDFKEDSLRVLADSATPIASGPAEVQALWARLCGLVPFSHFRSLHFHEFPVSSAPAQAQGDELSRLVYEYRRSLTAERLESEIVNLETQATELTQAKNPAAKVEAALERLTQQLKNLERLPDLSEVDFQFLESQDKRSQAHQSELEEINKNLADAQRRQAAVHPTPLLTDRLFLIGIVGGIAFIVAGVILGQVQGAHFRALALGDILAFGLSTLLSLRHFDLKGRHKLLQVRIDYLESRQQELTKTHEREELRLKKLLRRYDSDSPQQVLDDLRTRDELREKRIKLAERLKEHLKDPVFVRQRKELANFRERIEPLRERRRALGEYVTAAYELRAELLKRGVAVDSLQALDAHPESSLVELGRLLQLLPQAETAPATMLEGINRLVPPILGKPQAQVALENGKLVVTEDRSSATPLSDLDARAQIPWLRAVALGLLVQYNRERSRSGEHAAIIVLDDPWSDMQRSERIRLYGLLKEIAKVFQVVLPKTGE
ncbi:MAG: hypothetical protein RBU37_17570 [Myxococcota bacterium]|jgi:hypothetical protein|nr:hypothetical protein [Myxococcota bacterium]